MFKVMCVCVCEREREREYINKLQVISHNFYQIVLRIFQIKQSYVLHCLSSADSTSENRQKFVLYNHIKRFSGWETKNEEFLGTSVF
jgi:hypothetical protein